MYTSYYDPEIFQSSLDGIDLDSHCTASYRIRDCVEGAKFLDHFSLVQSIAIEGSTGSHERVTEDTQELRMALTTKVIGYHEIQTDDPHTKSAVIQLAFPVQAWGDNLPMMMLAIVGNIFAISQEVMMTDFTIGKELLEKYQGPKFGVSGIRELTGINDRPLSLHIIKPKMGMTPEQTADQVYQTALGGADMCKDDEMLVDCYNSKAEERVPRVMEAIEKAAEKTGKKMIYFCSITDESEKMLEKAHKIIELGGNGLLVAYSTGLSALRKLTSDPDISVPVLLHASHMVSMMKSVSWPVFGKFGRLCGADCMLTPTYWGSMPMVSHEEGIRTGFVKLAPWRHIKRTWPMPCAGTVPGLMPLFIGEYGPDIIIPSGGGMLGHPDGYTAGAKAWQQAIQGVMDPEADFLEFAKRPENKELRRALEKWGYIERPPSPWMRRSPRLEWRYI